MEAKKCLHNRKTYRKCDRDGDIVCREKMTKEANKLVKKLMGKCVCIIKKAQVSGDGRRNDIERMLMDVANRIPYSTKC